MVACEHLAEKALVVAVLVKGKLHVGKQIAIQIDVEHTHGLVEHGVYLHVLVDLPLLQLQELDCRYRVALSGSQAFRLVLVEL